MQKKSNSKRPKSHSLGGKDKNIETPMFIRHESHFLEFSDFVSINIPPAAFAALRTRRRLHASVSVKRVGISGTRPLSSTYKPVAKRPALPARRSVRGRSHLRLKMAAFNANMKLVGNQTPVTEALHELYQSMQKPDVFKATTQALDLNYSTQS